MSAREAKDHWDGLSRQERQRWVRLSQTTELSPMELAYSNRMDGDVECDGWNCDCTCIDCVERRKGRGMAKKAAAADGPVYYTWAHNVHGCLRNGSFVRKWSNGTIGQYMNGDFMGAIDAVPDKMTEVPLALAMDLLPKCCK